MKKKGIHNLGRIVYGVSTVMINTSIPSPPPPSHLAEEWRPVLSGGVRSEVEEFLRQDAQLEEYAGKVLHFSSYVENASHVPTSTLLHVFR